MKTKNNIFQNSNKTFFSKIGVLLLFLTTWEIIGRIFFSEDVFPPISKIIINFWEHHLEYLDHIFATLNVAFWGFLFGNMFSIIIGLTFFRFPIFERYSGGILVIIFSLPLLILILIINSIFKDRVIGAIIFTSIVVFFPTLENFKVGLKNIGGNLLDIVDSIGGSRWDKIIRVRIPSALPSLIAGFQVAFPSAILGAMLSEFVGAPKGLGIFLIGTITQGTPAGIWAISLVSALLGASGYFIFSLLGEKISPHFVSEKIKTNISSNSGSGNNKQAKFNVKAIGEGFLSFLCIPITIWFFFSTLFKGKLGAKGPIDILEYFFVLPESGKNFNELISNIPETLMLAIIGLTISIIAAFIFASLFSINTWMATFFLPLVLISQTVPIIAWIPILKLAISDTECLTVMITISATFFPGFIFLYKGLNLIPSNHIDIFNTYKASRFQEYSKLKLPSAIPYFTELLRITAPRAVLGVILAEYFVSLNGLGGVIYVARGKLDFSMMWGVAITVGIISLIFYQILDVMGRIFESIGFQQTLFK